MVWVWWCGGGRGQAPLRGMVEWWNASHLASITIIATQPVLFFLKYFLFHLHIQHGLTLAEIIYQSCTCARISVLPLCAANTIYNTLKSSFLSPIIDNMSQLLSTSFERMSKWETCQLDDFWNRELFLSTFCIAHVWYVWSFYVLWSLSSADKLYLLFPCVTILAAGLFDVPCFPVPSHLLIAAQCPHLARLRLAFQLMPLKSGASVCILYCGHDSGNG